MSDWRLANSLITLRDQVNAMYPNRGKASDGTIGDAAHAAVKSEHNPNSAGVVTAIDITHDPASGADMQKLADALVASKDNRIWYIIFNRRIWEGGWTAYSGTADPHTNHLHLSTNQSANLYDDGRQWKLKEGSMLMADENFINNCATAIGRQPAQLPYDVKNKTWRDQGAKGWLGQPCDVVLQGWLSSAEGVAWFKKAVQAGMTRASALDYVENHLQ